MEAAIGIVVLLVVLAFHVGLVLWSRRIIERIARRNLKSAREIM